MSRKIESTGPVNTAGTEYIEIDGYFVATWGPNPDGRPPQNQVHMALDIDGVPPLTVRFKSRRAMTEMIDLLSRYRDEVWQENGELTPWAREGFLT